MRHFLPIPGRILPALTFNGLRTIKCQYWQDLARNWQELTNYAKTRMFLIFMTFFVKGKLTKIIMGLSFSSSSPMLILNRYHCILLKYIASFENCKDKAFNLGKKNNSSFYCAFQSDQIRTLLFSAV